MTGTAVIQSTLIPHLSLGGIKPDIVLLVVISWSLLRGAEEGVVWGLIGGILLDLLSGAPFGVFTIAMAAVSFLTGMGEMNVFRTNIALPLATIFFATIAYNLIFLILLQAMGWPIAWIDGFIRVILPTTLLNTLLMPIVYKLMHWLHRRTGREEISW